MEAPLAGLVVGPLRGPLARPWRTGQIDLQVVILLGGGVADAPDRFTSRDWIGPKRHHEW